MKNYNAENADAYVASAPVESHEQLETLRKLVKSTVPNAEEGISYGVPFYKHFGMLAGIAAHKNHASIWFPTMRLDAEDRQTLENMGYGTGDKTIRITFDQELPTTMIEQYLTSTARMNEAKKSAK